MTLRYLLILICAQLSSGQQACVDDGADCTQWAVGGECKANPDYMLANCRKSCNVCSEAKGSAGHGTPGGTKGKQQEQPKQQTVPKVPKAIQTEPSNHTLPYLTRSSLDVG